ncbi:MAG: methyltransferase domain-containing protein [Anaerolineales bacterium]|nr:methyltransferase domain-containing protein [Anaerolineales bacterium]
MMATVQTQNYQQILTHTNSELERLIDQASFFGQLTEHVFRLAGLEPGMRVLDIGCGAGDVSFLAAKLVGEGGEVIGVDKSPQAVALASQRATAAGLPNVHFVTADLTGFVPDEPVDALIGRLVLMYFSDPAVLLRRLSQFVQPGGVVVFHELDMTATKSLPRCDLFETSTSRITQAFTRAGAEMQMGLKLAQTFLEAGLPCPEMIQGARLGHGPDSPAYKQVAEITRTLLPLMERVGVATAIEVDIDTLEERLRQEVVANHATVVAPPYIGAWARLIGSIEV